MSKDYQMLPTCQLTDYCTYESPWEPPEVVYLEDPATYVLIDFQQTKPLTIAEEARMFDARQQMEDRHIPVSLVIDNHNCLSGIISMEDILSERPVKLQEELRIERKKLKVKHIMEKKDGLISVDFATLEKSQVGHVIQTLQQLKQHYLLVTEKTQKGNKIRGLLIDSQISRQLGMNIRQINGHFSIADLQRLLS